MIFQKRKISCNFMMSILYNIHKNHLLVSCLQVTLTVILTDNLNAVLNKLVNVSPIHCFKFRRQEIRLWPEPLLPPCITGWMNRYFSLFFLFTRCNTRVVFHKEDKIEVKVEFCILSHM